MDADNICRICWKRMDTLFSLFRSRHGASPFERLLSKTNLQFDFSEAGPSSICSQCLIELDTTVTFLEKCERSNRILAEKFSRGLEEECSNECSELEAVAIANLAPIQQPSPAVEPKKTLVTINSNKNKKSQLQKLSDVILKTEIVQKCPDCGSKRRCQHWAPPTSFTCTICDKVFNKKYNYQLHLKRHRGERDSPCPQCGALQLTESLAQRHCQPKVLKQCPTPNCGKTFTNNTNLQIHIIAHSGERPFECNDCGKGFTSKKTLTSHMRLHTGEKPYMCPVCGRRFTWNHLAAHARTHGAGAGVACVRGGCARTFRTRAALRSHLRTHGTLRTFLCAACPRDYKFKQSLNKHVRKRHGALPPT